METRQAIATRKSVRNFGKRQVSDQDLEMILKAANSAPVAHGEYHALHLTVVQDADVLDTIRETAVDCFRDPILDIYYGASTVIVISTSHGSIPELDMANAGTIGQTMMLAATDMGIDCCYIWGTALAFRAEPDLADDIELPEGHQVIGSVAFGYAEGPDVVASPPNPNGISVNRV